MPINPDEFTFREARHDDLDEFADLYCTLWTNSLRNRGDFDDGRPIALCCVGLFDDGKPRTNEHWHAIYEDLLAQATERLEQGGDERLAGCLFGDTREKATADRFAATGNEFAQAQINLLIIRPEFQGKGLGGELIRRARAAVRDADRTKFFLMTDSESDWHFYDHLGMTRIAEDHSQDTGDGFVVYMYGDEA